MSENGDKSLVDKEELLETYRRLLGETKRKPLPEVTLDKKLLIERIHNLRIVKEDFTRSRRERIRAENESFECYERLLQLCGGDVDLVARLLGSQRPYPIKPEDASEP